VAGATLVAGVGWHPVSEGWLAMAESEKAKAHRLEKRREERRLKRERTGDTPEAEAERRQHPKDDDDDAAKRLMTRGVILT
jgi:hypothetical protein